mgnify:CR=1 FL=1
MKKILLLLEAGLVLGLTRRPDAYFRVLKDVKKEWQKINESSLRKAITNLYKSRLIGSIENKDGSITMTLTDKGRLVTFCYNIERLKLPKLKNWDGLWTMVLFDIPEYKKKARDTLSFKLKQLGFYPLQKSVFIYPYDCKKEIDFLIEFFELRPYVRMLRIKEIDVEPHLKDIFGIKS